MPLVNFNDQTELKTIVDAIAAASQREAEALERVYKLTQENDELHLKLKGYVEDNKQLVELYQQKATEDISGGSNKAEIALQGGVVDDSATDLEQLAVEKEAEMKKVIENLEQQLMEMHEENEKLMSLYEKAMQERDKFKGILSSGGQNRVVDKEHDCLEKFVEVDEGKHLMSGELAARTEEKESKVEVGFVESNIQDVREDLVFNKYSPSTEAISRQGEQTRSSPCPVSSQSKEAQIDSPMNEFSESDKTVGHHQSEIGTSLMEIDPSRISTTRLTKYQNLVKTKLQSAQGKLSGSAKTINLFGSLEKTLIEVNEVSRQMEVMEGVIEEKQRFLESLKVLHAEMKERKDLSDKKYQHSNTLYRAFLHLLLTFNNEKLEQDQGQGYVPHCPTWKKKKGEPAYLQACKGGIEASLWRMQESETEARNNLAPSKSRLEEENRRHENEKVLLAIDNVKKRDSTQRNRYLRGKATELLNSEEEKNKLQYEMKHLREKLGVMRKEFDDLNKKSMKVEDEAQAVLGACTARDGPREGNSL
ncbi:hypothetical protein SLA2020_182660 [Shorea laevis]